MEHSDDRRELVLQAGCSAPIPQLEASVFDGLENAERIIEREDDGARHRVVERICRAHSASLDDGCDETRQAAPSARSGAPRPDDERRAREVSAMCEIPHADVLTVRIVRSYCASDASTSFDGERWAS